MAITTKRLTYDDLVALQDLPEYEHVRLEIIGGELFVSPAPALSHQRVLLNVAYALEQSMRSRRTGVVFVAPVAVRFSPEDVVEPDIVFVGRDRHDILGQRVVDGAPDVAMEVLSPATRRRDLNEKRRLYERFGVLEYWIIDVSRREVTIYALRDGRYTTVPVTGAVARSGVVPDFAIALDDLFDLPF
jgi:Uma2 family endonuclease